MEDEEEGLCEEERALKPLVPARVTACDATGAADFWANSIPAMQRSKQFKSINMYCYNLIIIFFTISADFSDMKSISAALYTIKKQKE